MNNLLQQQNSRANFKRKLLMREKKKLDSQKHEQQLKLKQEELFEEKLLKQERRS